MLRALPFACSRFLSPALFYPPFSALQPSHHSGAYWSLYTRGRGCARDGFLRALAIRHSPTLLHEYVVRVTLSNPHTFYPIIPWGIAMWQPTTVTIRREPRGMGIIFNTRNCGGYCFLVCVSVWAIVWGGYCVCKGVGNSTKLLG